jgi:hypothetical protein
LLDAKTRLEDVSHREYSPSIKELFWLTWEREWEALSICKAAFGTNMGKGDGERFQSIVIPSSIASTMLKSALHLLYSHPSQAFATMESSSHHFCPHLPLPSSVFPLAKFRHRLVRWHYEVRQNLEGPTSIP